MSRYIPTVLRELHQHVDGVLHVFGGTGDRAFRKVIGDVLRPRLAQRGLRRRELNRHFGARAALRDHVLQAPKLPFDAPKARDDRWSRIRFQSCRRGAPPARQACTRRPPR